MKKQILFLAIFSLAVLAGTNNAWGQLGPATNPVPPLLCVSTAVDPLHPFAGVPYVYSLTDAAAETPALNYTWWATKNQQFITGPVNIADMSGSNFSTALASPDVQNVSTTYGSTTPKATAGSNQVTITWGADVLAGTDYQGIPGPGTPTFVVGYAQGDNCADNIQVYEINPMPNFTVDIAPIDPATLLPLLYDAATAEVCVDEIQSATYAAGNLNIDHGTNTIYYEVAAANFVTNWTPSFTIVSGLRTSQTATISMYSTLADATGAGVALATSGALLVGDMHAVGSGTFSWTPGVRLNATDPTDALTGVSVFVKVVIDNNAEESLTSNPFVLAVDARENNETGLWDMEDGDCTTLDDTIDQIDQATITVTPRPQLDDNTADTNPLAPNDRIIKNNP